MTRKIRPAAVATALFLLLTIAGCGESAKQEASVAPAPTKAIVDIPDVTGDRADDAESSIADAAPDVTVAYETEPNDPKLCTVSDQDEVGEAAPDATVTLTLECEVKVPDVTGETANEARDDIEANGDLTATFDDEPTDPSQCTVSDQDPAGGAKVSSDTEVTLTLTCGVEVPDVTGEPADQAKSEIDDVDGLTSSFDTEPSDPASCTVDSQDPDGGQSVDRDTAVTLTLSCDDTSDPGDRSSDDPDPSDPYTPPSSDGTTEDFDEGTGDIGTCADGTLTHSAGHQGACSQHGGLQ